MLHRTHNTREWTLVIAFSVFTLCFMLWVLLESRGTVQYPQWHTVKGHDYYQVFDRTLLPIFPICVFAVDLFVAGLTLWGLHRGAYLASFSIGLGTLLLMGISCQMFFEGFGKYLLTLISGCVMLIGACWLSRHPRIALTKRLHIRHAIAAMIVLLILLNVVFGKTINGSRAWVYFGPLHFQPGELFKPLLVLYGAFCFPCRQIKQLFPFLALSLSVVLLLVFIKDLGNAAIISVLMLVVCWYLSDKLTLTAGLLTAGISLGTIALHFRPALQNRFNSFQALASGSGQQYDGLLAILHNGLHGSGLAEGSGYLRSTCVTAAYNDVAALLPISIFGIGFAVLLLFSLIVLLLSPARNSGHSPFLLVLQSGCVAILFAQAALNLGGSLNVLPLTGVSFPILSSGGSSMIANFSLIGFLIGGFTYETETALQTLHVSYHGPGSSVPLRHRYRKFVATCRRNARRYVRQSVSGFRRW